jgi:hypothetical protein
MPRDADPAWSSSRQEDRTPANARQRGSAPSLRMCGAARWQRGAIDGTPLAAIGLN